MPLQSTRGGPGPVPGGRQPGRRERAPDPEERVTCRRRRCRGLREHAQAVRPELLARRTLRAAALVEPQAEVGPPGALVAFGALEPQLGADVRSSLVWKEALGLPGGSAGRR